MTWLKKDDKYPEHRKIRRLSDGAYRLHDTALCWAAKDETDGLIQADDLTEMQHGKRLSRYIPDLEAAGLWERVPGGWLIHDFLHYNPSHVQLDKERAAARERQARARAKRRGVNDSDNGHGVTNGVTTPEVTRESQPPVPNRTEPNRTEPLRTTEMDAAFDTFWEMYPKRRGKQDARKAFDKAVRDVGAETVLDGAARLAADPNLPVDATLIPNPSTWLNQGRWDDDPYPPRFTGNRQDDLFRRELARIEAMEAAVLPFPQIGG